MQDQFTEVTTKGWGSRILNSIKGVLVGFLMFIVSFGVLYWNEGRIDVSKIAETAIEINTATEVPIEADGQLISTSGIFQSEEKIGDTYLKKGSYMSIYRQAEMFSWTEETQSTSTSNTGGSETTETTYKYIKEWSSYSVDSSSFKYPEGHQNPQMSVESRSVSVQDATFGPYQVNMNQLTLPERRNITLDSNKIVLRDGFKLVSDKYLFKGIGTLAEPKVGDIRISYAVVPNPVNSATIFGQLDTSNQAITAYFGVKNTKLYRVFQGSRDSAISTMANEHATITWIFRGIGFALMWFGLMMLFNPLVIFMDVLPIFGTISKAGIGIVTFVLAFALSLITIIVSMIVHNIIALIIVVVGFVYGVMRYMKKQQTLQKHP